MRAWIGLPGVASGGSMRSVKLRAYIHICEGRADGTCRCCAREAVCAPPPGESLSECHWKQQHRSMVPYWWQHQRSISNESSERMPAKCAPHRSMGGTWHCCLPCVEFNNHLKFLCNYCPVLRFVFKDELTDRLIFCISPRSESSTFGLDFLDEGEELHGVFLILKD